MGHWRAKRNDCHFLLQVIECNLHNRCVTLVAQNSLGLLLTIHFILEIKFLMLTIMVKKLLLSLVVFQTILEKTISGCLLIILLLLLQHKKILGQLRLKILAFNITWKLVVILISALLACHNLQILINLLCCFLCLTETM